MKKCILLLAAFSSFSAFATSSINCSFTEPFINIDIDTKSGKVVLNSPDFSTDDYKLNQIDISKSVKVTNSLVNGVPTISVTDKKDGSSVLKAVLNYEGNDGMSDIITAYDAVYAYQGKGSKLFGGCDSEATPGIEESSLDANEQLFTKDLKAAVIQCYTRAQSAWTSKVSSEKNTSVFTVLYRSDFVPGEPGDVSSTFSSAEGAELTRLANLAKKVPQTAAELKAHTELKVNFCDFYSKRLHSRVVRAR
jgi:hypothetical protein